MGNVPLDLPRPPEGDCVGGLISTLGGAIEGEGDVIVFLGLEPPDPAEGLPPILG